MIKKRNEGLELHFPKYRDPKRREENNDRRNKKQRTSE